MSTARQAFGLLLVVEIAAVAISAAVLSPATVAPSAGGTALPIDVVRTGSVTRGERARVLEQAFRVPPGTLQIDIDFAYGLSRTESATQFDLGVRSPAGLRGWSEDHHGHIHIDATSASYGYLPGAIVPGQWSVLIGVASVPEGSTPYRLSIRMSAEPDTARPSLRSRRGWYAGDLHTHSGHSDGRTASNGVPVTVEDIAAAAARRGLDFVAVTDHNTTSQWVDVDRVQAVASRVLLLHGREITTYHGHFNAIGERRMPAADLRLERPVRDLMADAAADGSFVSINHPWLIDDEWCPGCRWTSLDDGTMETADGIEIANGPTPDDLPGWSLWAQMLDAGHHLVAVGGSDIHDLNGTDRHIGEPTTVVYANELSEDAIVSGLMSGRVYGRTDGPSGPQIDIRAQGDGGDHAVMGQTIPGGYVHFTASIQQAKGQSCVWIKRGHQLMTQPIASDHADLRLDLEIGKGDWVSVLYVPLNTLLRGRTRSMSARRLHDGRIADEVDAWDQHDRRGGRRRGYADDRAAFSCATI